MIPPAIDSDHFNAAVAAAFHIPLAGDSMDIPICCGEGSMYRKKIQDDFYLIFWTLNLRKKLSVNKRPVPPAEKSSSISITYIFPAGNADKKYSGSSLANNPKFAGNIFIVAGNSSIQFEIPEGEHIKIISLLVDIDWLKKELAAGDIIQSAAIDALCNKARAAPVQLATTWDDIHLMAEAAGQLQTGTRGLLLLKANLFLLIAGLFSRFMQSPGQHKDRHQYLHYNEMIVLENILTSHLEKKLPGLPALAKTMSLSPSTLKRNFKLVFGKNIHQYYVEQKMNYAMKMLTEKFLPVNVVANLLQYENVSGFIATFKKHHGRSPGSVSKHAGHEK